VPSRLQSTFIFWLTLSVRVLLCKTMFLLNYMVPLVYSALVQCGVKFCWMVLMYVNGPLVFCFIEICLYCDIPVALRRIQ
jgi:hypothetical protein